MERPHLLTLPRELRLEIWSYVLTDPSMTNLVLDIRRKQSAPSLPAQRYMNSLHKSSILEPPDLCTEFEKPRSKSINLHFLRTCRFVYEDALPTLYHSVTFCLQDVEGILPLFLAPLSPFAKSHIRYIKLSVRESSRCSGSFFYWALTCAQVAGLAGLRRVDVAGEWPLTGNEYFRQSILFPLLKIKAPKSFLSDFNVEFQTLLHEAARNMEGQALIRKAAAAAEVAERSKLEYAERARQERIRQEQKVDEPAARKSSAHTNQDLDEHENGIASSLDTVAGIQQFEKELLHLNMESHSTILPHSTNTSLENASVQSSDSATQPQTSQETNTSRNTLPGSIESNWKQSVETLIEDSHLAKSKSRSSTSTLQGSPAGSTVKAQPQVYDLERQETPNVGWTCGIPWRALSRQHKRSHRRTNTHTEAHQVPTTVAKKHSIHSKKLRLRSWLASHSQTR